MRRQEGVNLPLVQASDTEPGRREGDKGDKGNRKEGEVEEEELGFRLAPSHYLNTIRQVHTDFTGEGSSFSMFFVVLPPVANSSKNVLMLQNKFGAFHIKRFVCIYIYIN